MPVQLLFLALFATGCGRIGYDAQPRPVSFADAATASGDAGHDGAMAADAAIAVDGGDCPPLGPSALDDIGPRPATPLPGLAPLDRCGPVYESVVLTADLVASGGTCLTVQAPNVTIEGAGHTIVADEAIESIDRPGLRIRNLVTAGRVEILEAPGGEGDAARIEDSEIGALWVLGADDVVVEHNRLASLFVADWWGNPAERAVVDGNLVEGGGNSIVDVKGGEAGGCPTVTGHVFVHNRFVSTVVEPIDAPEVLYVRCASGNVFRDLSVEAPGAATGLALADASADNLFEDVRFAAATPDVAGIRISANDPAVGAPNGNTFHRVVVDVAAGAPLHSIGTGGGNRFEEVVIAGTAASLLGADGGDRFDHATFVHRGTGLAIVAGVDAVPEWRLPGVLSIRNSVVYSASAEVLELGPEALVDTSHNVYFSPSGAAYVAGESLGERQQSGGDVGSLEGDPRLASIQPVDARPRDGSIAVGADDAGGVAGAYACVLP